MNTTQNGVSVSIVCVPFLGKPPRIDLSRAHILLETGANMLLETGGLILVQ